MINLETAWRPHEPGIEKRFFIADDRLSLGGAWWVGCARDRRHFIQLLADQGAEWETDSGLGDVDINEALQTGIVEVRELTADEVARRQRCHTEDERGVIPLSEAAIGDLFCSEW